MMPRLPHYLLLAVCFLATAEAIGAEPDKAKLDELNTYWAEVSRSVREGDFAGYAATCHPQGVLVSEARQTSYPLKKALARWKQGFLDTRNGKIKASVEFRFSQRIGDQTTSHETGIFRYATVDGKGKESVALIHLAALLVKADGRWLVLMEHQKGDATIEEWNALKSE